MAMSMESTSKLPDDVAKNMPAPAQDAWKRAADETGDLEALVADVGRSCALPGAFIAPAFLFQKSESPDYVAAVRQNILAAGDTCSRGILVGAVMAALGSEPPADWLAKVDKATMDRIDAVANQLADIAVANAKDEL